MKTFLAFALGCVVTLSLGFAAQTKAVTFEYKVVQGVETGDADKRANELAAQGWELVSVTPIIYNGNTYRKNDLYFKRLKP